MLGDELFFPGDDELAEQENLQSLQKNDSDNSSVSDTSDKCDDSTDVKDSSVESDSAQHMIIPSMIADMSLDDETDTNLSQSDDRSDRTIPRGQPIAIPSGQLHFRVLDRKSNVPVASRVRPDGTLSCTYTPDYKRDELVAQRPPSRNTVKVIRAQTQPHERGPQNLHISKQRTLKPGSKPSVK